MRGFRIAKNVVDSILSGFITMSSKSTEATCICKSLQINILNAVDYLASEHGPPTQSPWQAITSRKLSGCLPVSGNWKHWGSQNNPRRNPSPRHGCRRSRPYKPSGRIGSFSFRSIPRSSIISVTGICLFPLPCQNPLGP